MVAVSNLLILSAWHSPRDRDLPGLTSFLALYWCGSAIRSGHAVGSLEKDQNRGSAGVLVDKIRTRTLLALQILQARFWTLPSALTTSGANSTPNLQALVRSCIYPGEQKIAKLTSGEQRKPPVWQTCLAVRQGRQTAHPLSQVQPRGHDRSNYEQQAAGLFQQHFAR